MHKNRKLHYKQIGKPHATCSVMHLVRTTALSMLMSVHIGKQHSTEEFW